MAFHCLNHLVHISLGLIISGNKGIGLLLTSLKEPEQTLLLLFAYGKSLEFSYKAREHVTYLAHVLGSYVVKGTL